MQWSGLPWVDTLMESSSKARTRLKNKIINGVKFYNAKWYKPNLKDNGKSRLRSLDPKAENLYKLLNSKELEFIGFSPIVPYIKEKGSKEDLKAYWNHHNSTPGLLFKHKDLPLLLIASPTIRLDDSLLNEIDANSKEKVQLKGISS